jgi:dTDP-4-dehydrorhamnose reductase
VIQRWFVTGGGGQLATAFADALPGDVFLSREESLDIRDAAAVRTAVRAFAPEVILHTAAYTNVDGAEADEATATAINAGGTRNLVSAVRGTNTRLVYFSTDYVFDGRKAAPYVESDETNPLGAYGRSKLAGEREALAWVRGIVVRTAWLYSATGRNFVRTILAAAQQRLAAGLARPEPLRVVDDQVGSPTYARHLAIAVGDALEAGLQPGLYHMAGAGSCSWFELAREIVQLAGLEVEVVPISTAEAGRPAPRPAFSVLASERGGASLPSWLDGVRQCVDELLSSEESS